MKISNHLLLPTGSGLVNYGRYLINVQCRQGNNLGRPIGVILYLCNYLNVSFCER